MGRQDTASSSSYANNLDPWVIWGNFEDVVVQTQLVSVFRQIVQNISFQFPEFSNSNGSPSSTSHNYYNYETLFDRSNSTNLGIFSDTFQNFGDSPLGIGLDFLEHQVLYFVLLYGETFATLLLTFVGGWLANRLFLKSEIITDILETVISLLLFLPVSPFVFAFFLGIVILRLLISLMIFLVYPNGKYSLLNPVDGFWAYEEFASCSTCLGLYIIEGECDPKKIRDNMQKTFKSDLVGGKMNRKITTIFGFACWENIKVEDMDMKEYIKVVDCKQTNGEIPGEDDIFEVMKNIQDTPIQNKAPWEIYVIPSFSYNKKESEKCKKCYAVIYRIHHAIMDGISTANILHSIMADKPFKFTVDPMEPLGKRKPSVWENALVYTLGFISIPRVGLRNLCLLDNIHNKFYIPGPMLKGPKTFSWSKPIKLDALKHIKNSTKTSVYSVLLSSLGGAFRQFNEKNGYRYESEYFHVMLPLALLPYRSRKPTNRFTGVIVPTCIGKGDLSPTERLRTNYKNLRQLGSTSATFLAVANWYYPVILGLLPLFLHKPLSWGLHLRMTLSNVPGPSEDVFIYDGGKILDMAIFLPIKYTMGFGMGLFSYKDKVRATVVGDRAYYPKESDVYFIKNAFEDELLNLGKSLGLEDVFAFTPNETTIKE